MLLVATGEFWNGGPVGLAAGGVNVLFDLESFTGNHAVCFGEGGRREGEEGNHRSIRWLMRVGEVAVRRTIENLDVNCYSCERFHVST